VGPKELTFWHRILAETSSDISDYLGWIQIRFRFASDRAVNYESWYVDDIEITAPPVSPNFIRGDVNADGNVNSADLSYLATYLFSDGNTPPCLLASEVNNDGNGQYNGSFLFG